MDAAAGEPHLRVFKALRDAGELTARVNLAINRRPGRRRQPRRHTIAQAKALAAQADPTGRCRTGRALAASSRSSWTASSTRPADTGALLTPYLRNTGTDAAPNWVPGTNLGELYYTPASLKALMLAAADAGWTCTCTPPATAPCARARCGLRRAQPRPGADFRPAIAHDETVAVADYPRFAALDVMATMSFQWAQRAPYSIGETESHLGPERFARMEPSAACARRRARRPRQRLADRPVRHLPRAEGRRHALGRPDQPAQRSEPRADLRRADQCRPRAVARRRAAAITMNAAHQLRIETQSVRSSRQVRRPDRARRTS